MMQAIDILSIPIAYRAVRVICASCVGKERKGICVKKAVTRQIYYSTVGTYYVKQQSSKTSTFVLRFLWKRN